MPASQRPAAAIHDALGRVRSLLRRSRYVRESASYLLREAVPGARTATYTPRGADVQLDLRHNTPDISMVQEVFDMHLYEPPRAVEPAWTACGSQMRVLDLGGHVGTFAAWALTRRPSAHVLSVEPDPQTYALLSRSAARERRDWRTMEAAAATEAGHATFAALGEPGSHLTGGDGGITVETIDALELIADADFVKMDIEGGEWAIFADPRWVQSAPKLLVLEYHPEGAPGRGDFHADAVAAMERAGLEHAPIAGAPAGAGMLWAWRP